MHIDLRNDKLKMIQSKMRDRAILQKDFHILTESEYSELIKIIDNLADKSLDKDFILNRMQQILGIDSTV